MTKIQAKNPVLDVTGGFFFFAQPTHTIQKTGPETRPLAILRVELHSDFHEKRNFDRCSWFFVHNSRLSIV